MRKSAILWCLWAFLTPAPAVAEYEASRFELTPLLAYRLGGEFEQPSTGADLKLDESKSVGLIFNIRLDADSQLEIFYSRQATELDTEGLFVNQPVLDIDIDYLHFGGTYAFASDSDLGRPYIVGTLGASRFAPKPSGLDSETFFSFSFGGGVNLFPSKRLGLRLEGRLFGTLIDSDNAIFCQTGADTNFCAVSVQGDLLFQWQAMAGLVVRF